MTCTGGSTKYPFGITEFVNQHSNNQIPNDLQTSDDTDSDLKNWQQEYNASGGQFFIGDIDGSDSSFNSIFSTPNSNGATEQRTSKVEKNEVEPNEKKIQYF